jgi:hypothetical protein
MHRSGLIDTPFETAFCSGAEFRDRTADSNSRNALSFSSARTMKRFPSSRCASTIQIVRPRESTAETQPQLHPALLAAPSTPKHRVEDRLVRGAARMRDRRAVTQQSHRRTFADISIAHLFQQAQYSPSVLVLPASGFLCSSPIRHWLSAT